jgi:hypothetical protein
MGNEKKERIICGYRESEVLSHLDYVTSIWELTPLEKIITPENDLHYSDREEGDLIFRCKICGFEEIEPARRIMGMHNCYYCCKLAEHLASRSFSGLDKVKHEDVQNAVGEFRDFLTNIYNLILLELEVSQRTDLIPSFECLSELFCNYQPVSRVDSWFVGALIETKHHLVVALIIDLLAWIQETEDLVEADGPHYPLPWRGDSSNQRQIGRAISTLEKLRKRAIDQSSWIKDETGFRGPSLSELSSTSSFASELSDKLPWEE